MKTLRDLAEHMRNFAGEFPESWAGPYVLNMWATEIDQVLNRIEASASTILDETSKGYVTTKHSEE